MKSHQERGFKPGIDSGARRDRRANASQDALRKKRMGKLADKRGKSMGGQLATSQKSVQDMIMQDLDMDAFLRSELRQFQVLCAITCHPDSHRYFGPAPLVYPEMMRREEGERVWLFEDPRVIRHLIATLNHPYAGAAEPQLLVLAAHILINIAGYEVAGMWVPMLVEAGILEPIHNHLTQGTAELVDDCLHLLANIMLDNEHSRQEVLRYREGTIWSRVQDLATSQGGYQENLIFCCYALVAKDQNSGNMVYPSVDQVATTGLPILCEMVRWVTNLPDGPVQGQRDLWKDLLLAVRWMARAGDPYRALLWNHHLIGPIIQYSRSSPDHIHLVLAAEICELTSRNSTLHGDMQPLQDVFTALLTEPDPELRTCGVTGLGNLVSNADRFQAIVRSEAVATGITGMKLQGNTLVGYQQSIWMLIHVISMSTTTLPPPPFWQTFVDLVVYHFNNFDSLRLLYESLQGLIRLLHLSGPTGPCVAYMVERNVGALACQLLTHVSPDINEKARELSEFF